MPLRAEQTSLQPHPLRGLGCKPFVSHTPLVGGQPVRGQTIRDPDPKLGLRTDQPPLLARGRIRAGRRVVGQRRYERHSSDDRAVGAFPLVVPGMMYTDGEGVAHGAS
jgi:hypothetical protein